MAGKGDDDVMSSQFPHPRSLLLAPLSPSRSFSHIYQDNCRVAGEASANSHALCARSSLIRDPAAIRSQRRHGKVGLQHALSVRHVQGHCIGHVRILCHLRSPCMCVHEKEIRIY